jgi:hypothetical protein
MYQTGIAAIDIRTRTLKNTALARTDCVPKPFTANRNGFSLNA